MEPQFDTEKRGLKELAARWETHPARLEMAQREPVTREESIENLREFIKEQIHALPEVKEEARTHHIPQEELEQFLQQAVELAFQQGLPKAVAAVYATNNDFLTDAFHDLLVGAFFDQLVGMGKIKLK